MKRSLRTLLIQSMVLKVDVPTELDAYGIEINKGKQTFDGETTMTYLRFASHQDDEWNRISRQNAVLKSLQKKIAYPSILSKVPDLYEQVKDVLVTDLSIEQILSLSCVVSQTPPEQVKFETIPSDIVTIETNRTMQITDMDTLKQHINDFFGE